MANKKTGWEDTTSYRNDGPRVPREFEIRTESLRITLHRYIGYPPETWLCSARPLFDKQVMDSTDADEAKAQGLALVKATIAKWAKEVEKL